MPDLILDKLKIFSGRSSLSARLLLLTIFFVLLAEVLIYIPSIANFRKTWLEDKLSAAHIAVLAIEAAPDYMISEMLTKELLSSADVVAIVQKRGDSRQLVLATDKPLDVAARYDLRDATYWSLTLDAFKTMFHSHPNEKLIEVTGLTRDDKMDYIQIIFQEELLCHDMLIFSRNVLFLSIIISLITASLLFYTLTCILIRPVKKITDSMVAFRKAPEDYRQQLTPENRQDEIGTVMLELAHMQDQVRKALNQKNHLAKLGEAVSKINHDLRNILASAQLVSDHLQTVDNPVVQKLAPRFVKALDRGIRLCENTLQYGKAESEKPQMNDFALKTVIDDVETSLGIVDHDTLKIINQIPADLMLHADTDQIFRVILNLARNAAQAMGDKGSITFSASREDDQNIIEIRDDGPGIPDKIRQTLFQPFRSSAQGSGSGLGLAISKEIIEAHGGSIELRDTGPQGSTFRLILP